MHAAAVVDVIADGDVQVVKLGRSTGASAPTVPPRAPDAPKGTSAPFALGMSVRRLPKSFRTTDCFALGGNGHLHLIVLRLLKSFAEP